MNSKITNTRSLRQQQIAARQDNRKENGALLLTGRFSNFSQG
jgi:hypothetical protein